MCIFAIRIRMRISRSSINESPAEVSTYKHCLPYAASSICSVCARRARPSIKLLTLASRGRRDTACFPLYEVLRIHINFGLMHISFCTIRDALASRRPRPHSNCSTARHVAMSLDQHFSTRHQAAASKARSPNDPLPLYTHPVRLTLGIKLVLKSVLTIA